LILTGSYCKKSPAVIILSLIFDFIQVTERLTGLGGSCKDTQTLLMIFKLIEFKRQIGLFKFFDLNLHQFHQMMLEVIYFSGWI
jgi:hypothetical protein